MKLRFHLMSYLNFFIPPVSENVHIYVNCHYIFLSQVGVLSCNGRKEILYKVKMTYLFFCDVRQRRLVVSK